MKFDEFDKKMMESDFMAAQGSWLELLAGPSVPRAGSGLVALLK